jgi:hypothetical protein
VDFNPNAMFLRRGGIRVGLLLAVALSVVVGLYITVLGRSDDLVGSQSRVAAASDRNEVLPAGNREPPVLAESSHTASLERVEVQPESRRTPDAPPADPIEHVHCPVYFSEQRSGSRLGTPTELRSVEEYAACARYNPRKLVLSDEQRDWIQKGIDRFKADLAPACEAAMQAIHEHVMGKVRRGECELLPANVGIGGEEGCLVSCVPARGGENYRVRIFPGEFPELEAVCDQALTLADTAQAWIHAAFAEVEAESAR